MLRWYWKLLLVCALFAGVTCGGDPECDGGQTPDPRTGQCPGDGDDDATR